jgi:hypothetical protein
MPTDPACSSSDPEEAPIYGPSPLQSEAVWQVIEFMRLMEEELQKRLPEANWLLLRKMSDGETSRDYRGGRVDAAAH